MLYSLSLYGVSLPRLLSTSRAVLGRLLSVNCSAVRAGRLGLGQFAVWTLGPPHP